MATPIWELDAGELVTYDVLPGRAYTSFLEQREARREQQRRAYEAATAERGRQRAVIDELKTHGSHNYSAVRSREIALARVDVLDGPRKERRQIGVALTAARRAKTGWAVDIVDVAKSYDRPLFSGLRMRIARGERVAIVGPNGSGKTTLLQIVAGTLAPDRGDVRYGVGLTTAATRRPRSTTSRRAIPHRSGDADGRHRRTGARIARPFEPRRRRRDKPVAFSGGDGAASCWRA